VDLQLAYLGDGTGHDPTLDSAAATHFMPDFIKIDVEGAEASVLRGARRILTERMPSMVVEMHHPEVEAQCRELLRSCGYEPHTVTRTRGSMSESIGAGHNRWLVCEGRPLSCS
jgi:hypothetical protein